MLFFFSKGTFLGQRLHSNLIFTQNLTFIYTDPYAASADFLMWGLKAEKNVTKVMGIMKRFYNTSMRKKCFVARLKIIFITNDFKLILMQRFE
jgi:hypothetical protein